MGCGSIGSWPWNAALAAVQHTEIVAFARSQVEAHLAQVGVGGLETAVGRGVGDQIGLACKVSAFHGSWRLDVVRALGTDLPATAGLLAAGQISERVAEIVVSDAGAGDAGPGSVSGPVL